MNKIKIEDFKFILGRKIGMAQIFKENVLVPVTVIQAGPCRVLELKTKDKDGYNAVKLGFEEKKEKFRFIKEFKLPELNENFKVGDEMKVDIFEIGELVNVSSKRKAKGFAGVVKRHGFAGGPRTHGQEDRERHPGSIGQRWPQRVRKGLKMAGRIAPIKVTVKNLEIIEIIPEKNLLLLKGSVPGPNKTLVEIRSAYLTNKGNLYLNKKIIKNLSLVKNEA